MSGARFARTGRGRFLAGFCALFLVIGMVVFFHSSQQDLEEIRNAQMQCEQNMEAIRKRWQFTVEQKFELEKAKEQELSELLTQKRNSELKMQEQNDQHAKEQLDTLANLQKLQQSYKKLQKDLDSKNLELDAANKKMENLQKELQNEKEHESKNWKEKYEFAITEKLHLQDLLKAATSKDDSVRVQQLEDSLLDYKKNCNYTPQVITLDKSLPQQQQHQQINKPLSPPDITHKSGLEQLSQINKPKSDKFFNEQQIVSPGFYHIAIKTKISTSNAINKFNISNNTANNYSINGDGALKSQPKHQQKNNNSLILNSVENFQILPKLLKKMSEEMQDTQIKEQPQLKAPSANADTNSEKNVLPLSAPRKLTSTQSAKFEQHHVLEADHVSLQQSVINASNSTISSTSSLPPLPLPPNQRKQLPDMVAPIPKFVEIPQQNDVAGEGNDKKVLEQKIVGEGGDGDIDAAIEDTGRKPEDDEESNNRYANVVNDLEGNKKQKQKPLAIAENNDSGAHEVKDQDVANELNFNLPAEEDDNNFFDAGEKIAVDAAANGSKHKDDLDNEDNELGLGGNGDIGDIVLKNPQLMDAENLNNEVAGDQGKEFPDGLHSEEGNDEDEDDVYGNVAAHHQGAEAIRN